ncbi:hypothetical protein [Streptomyces sp. NPDC093261]
MPHLLVQDGDVGAPEGGERLVARREHIAARGRAREVVGEGARVGGRRVF